MEYRILGPVEVLRDGEQVVLDGAKPRTVLAALLISGRHMLSDSRLSELLWGKHPPATSNAQIYTYVSRLRKQLGAGASIVRRSPGYLMNIGEARLDLEEFEEQVRLGRAALATARHEEASCRLRRALRLRRGPALVNAAEPLADTEGARLEEAWLSALESRIEADLALGLHDHLTPELVGLVRQHPLRERFRAQLMTTLYRCDRQAEALALYDEGRRLLADELGIEPGARLRRVHQAILTADPLVQPQRELTAASGAEI